MTTYRYKARTSDGRLVSGEVEAYDEFEAVDQIKRSCPVVEKIKPVKESVLRHIDLNEPLWVADKTLSVTASQFAIMLRAGIPVGRAVEIVASQTSDRLMKRILTACSADINAGNSLSQSLEKNGGKIPAAFIETVWAGEESGTLDTCFMRLKEYYDRSHKVKSKVRSALIYPAFLVVLAIIVVIIVMVRLVPVMVSMFESMGSELPAITRALIGISNLTVRFWPFVLVGIVLLILMFRLYSKTAHGQIALAKLVLKLPIVGKIAVFNASSQFANTFCTLLSAGMPIARVLRVVSRVVDNRAIGSSLEKSVADLEAGKSLGKSLKDNEFLPEMLIEMVTVGEESGSLEDTLSTIGTYYDNEAVAASDRALSMLEPAITVIMGLFVAFIVAAIYIPMFSMYGGIA